MKYKHVCRQVDSQVRQRIALLGLFLALIVAPITNAQQPPSIANYDFPNCKLGYSCDREYLFSSVEVGSGFTAHLTFFDNLPDGLRVVWTITWADVAGDGSFQYQPFVNVKINNGLILLDEFTEMGPCTENGCQYTMDIVDPVCDYNQVGKTCPIPPAKMNLVVVGWAGVDYDHNHPDAPTQIASLKPPTLQVLYNGADAGNPLPAIWLDQVQPDESWVSTVTFGGTANDCTLAVVNLSLPPRVGPTAIATLTKADLSVIAEVAVPVNLTQQFQLNTFKCSDLFPQTVGVPETTGVIKVSFEGGLGAIALQQQTSQGITPEPVLPLVHPARRGPQPPEIRPRPGTQVHRAKSVNDSGAGGVHGNAVPE